MKNSNRKRQLQVVRASLVEEVKYHCRKEENPSFTEVMRIASQLERGQAHDDSKAISFALQLVETERKLRDIGSTARVNVSETPRSIIY